MRIIQQFPVILHPIYYLVKRLPPYTNHRSQLTIDAVKTMEGSEKNSPTSITTQTSDNPTKRKQLTSFPSLQTFRRTFTDVSPTSSTTPDGSSFGRQNTNIFGRKFSIPTFPTLSRRQSQAPVTPTDHLHELTRIDTIVRPANPDVFHAPSFKLSPYGLHWSADPIVLLNNSLRHQAKSLFFILYCLHERSETIVEGDIKSFYAWFKPYRDFFSDAVNFIHEVYLPWVQRAAPLPHEYDMTYFVDKGKNLQRTVRKTMAHQKDVMQFAPTKAARRLRTVFSKFAPYLLNYLYHLEEHTVPIVKSKYSKEDCHTITLQIVSHFSSTSSFKQSIVILLGWLQDRPQDHAKWRKQYLDRKTFLAFPLWQRGGIQEDCLAYFTRMCKTQLEEI